MIREGIILLFWVPIALILWNQPGLERRNTWSWLKWIPFASVFIGLIVVSKLIPEDCPLKIRQKMFLHLLSIFVASGLVVVIVWMRITYVALYGVDGHREFWLDLKNRLQGK
jgi:hypothetical protein